MSKIKRYLDNKGLTTLVDTLKKYFGRVKTVDGESPDENGNVQLSWIGTKTEWEALDKSQFAGKGPIKVYFTDVVKYEPAVLATNYSTEETIIGRWIDGRPLYRRVLLCTTTTTLTYQSGWTNVPGWSVTIPDVNKFVRISINPMFGEHAINYKLNPLQFSNSAGLAIEAGMSLIIEYTKTTDSPTV